VHDRERGRLGSGREHRWDSFRMLWIIWIIWFVRRMRHGLLGRLRFVGRFRLVIIRFVRRFRHIHRGLFVIIRTLITFHSSCRKLGLFVKRIVVVGSGRSTKKAALDLLSDQELAERFRLLLLLLLFGSYSHLCLDTILVRYCYTDDDEDEQRLQRRTLHVQYFHCSDPFLLYQFLICFDTFGNDRLMMMINNVIDYNNSLQANT